MIKIISNQPPKGTSDWLPDEFNVRQYIFDTWKRVCELYGFEQYLTPVFESAELYRAKSGDEVGGKELMTITDRAGREFALRPEMTPSVTRLVTRIYDQAPKPLKLFSIANFIRNEKPQRGRNREFWQLNCDTFGTDSLAADIEVMQIALDIMLAFNPPKDSFCLYINNRKLINDLLALSGIADDRKLDTIRLMDKWNKLDPKDLESAFAEIEVSRDSFVLLEKFMKSKTEVELGEAIPKLKDSEGFKEIVEATVTLRELGYGEYVNFKADLIRGFDYYDGIVFEIFDKHPDNLRAMFGGGRYNGLAEIFGKTSFPAVGFAPGDETTKLFLESWGLLDKIKKTERYYLPLLDESLTLEYKKLSGKLRGNGLSVEAGLEAQKLNKALEYANRKGFNKVVIFAGQEKEQEIYKIKDMSSGEETELKL